VLHKIVHRKKNKVDQSDHRTLMMMESEQPGHLKERSMRDG